MSQAQPPDSDLLPAMEALALRDADIARAFALCGLPPRRSQPSGFGGLVRMIVSQQVSAIAARAIVARLEAACRPLDAGTFLALDEAALRAIGFSRPKQLYTRLLAEEVASGRLDFAALDAAEDEEIFARLTALKGVGRWTAEIYLLFALRRPDVFPAQDLALQAAAQRLKALEARPDDKALRVLAEAWRPYRSAAARFLWHYYHHPGVPPLEETSGGEQAETPMRSKARKGP